MRRHFVIGIAVALGAGCRPDTIDTGDAQSKIKAWAEDNVAPVKDVSCPGAQLKKGVSFTCKVTFASGGPFDLVVEEQDDSGNVAWKWAKPIGGGAKLDEVVQKVIKDKTQADVTAKCPDAIAEVPAEGLPCDVTMNGGTVTLMVFLHDDNSVDIEPKK